MTESTRLRTPMVTIELPIVPSPPKTAKPYWWGFHRLGFYEPGQPANGEHWIWEKEIPEVEQSSRSASVRYDDHFGWILTLVMTHEKAKALLDFSKLPHQVETRSHTNTRDKP